MHWVGIRKTKLQSIRKKKKKIKNIVAKIAPMTINDFQYFFCHFLPFNYKFYGQSPFLIINNNLSKQHPYTLPIRIGTESFCGAKTKKNKKITKYCVPDLAPSLFGK